MMIRKVLLGCGIASSLLYVAVTILGAMQWQGYSWTSQSISELFALDAPSRSLVATAFLAYGVLVIAFGWGVWMAAGANRALRIAGGLLIGYGVVGVPGPLFFSMHTMVRGAPGGAQRDILHIILTAVLVLLILLSIGFGAAAFGKGFRLYSIGTLTLVVVFGALAGVQGGRMAANQPTPGMGIEERINIFGFLLWVVVLAIALLRAQTERPEANIDAPGARPLTPAVRGGAH
jgi:hypothetical protein